MKLLTAKDLNLLKGIFLRGEMSKFLAFGEDFLFLVRREMPDI